MSPSSIPSPSRPATAFLSRVRRLCFAAVLGALCLSPGPASLLQAQEAASGLLLVTNKGDRTLSFIDPQTNRQIATVPEEGITGHEVCTTPDGKFAYVPIFGNSGVGKPGTDGQIIRIIDLKKRAITGTIDFGRGVRPHHPVACARTGLIYVTTEIDNAVVIIDPATQKVLGSVPTGDPESHMLAVSSDGTRGYTANVGPGTVSVLDLENKKLLTKIQVASRVQRISLSVDDKLAFTSDQVQPQLAVIDTATSTVKTWIPLPDYGYGTAPTPDGKSLLVCIINRGEVAQVDLETMKVVRTLAVPKAPQAILVRPDGLRAYVSCDASAQVAAIDLKAWKVEALIDVGKTADGLAWAEGK